MAKCVYVSLKCIRNQFAAGLLPDQLGELTTLPESPNWYKKVREGVEQGKRGGAVEKRQREEKVIGDVPFQLRPTHRRP